MRRLLSTPSRYFSLSSTTTLSPSSSSSFSSPRLVRHALSARWTSTATTTTTTTSQSSESLGDAKIMRLPRNLKLSDPKILTTPEPRDFVYKPGTNVSEEDLRVPLLPNPFLPSKGAVNEMTKTIDLSPLIFQNDVNLGVMARVVRWQRNKAQAGTHKVLRKGEVSGTGKKPYKQKGSGKARQGSWRNPHMRGGGVNFGPTPRSHAHDLNIKERLVGLRSALCARFQEKRLVVVESLKSPEVTRTKQISKGVEEVLKSSRPLMIETLDGGRVDVPGPFHQLRLASRNLYNVDVLPPIGLNVMDILKHSELVVSLEALKELEKRFHKLRPKASDRSEETITARPARPWRRAGSSRRGSAVEKTGSSVGTGSESASKETPTTIAATAT